MKLSNKREFTLKSLLGSPPSSHEAFLPLTVPGSDARHRQLKGAPVVP